MFNEIRTEKNIQNFIDKTNSLHDGYIIGVQYTNDIMTNVDENGYATVAMTKYYDGTEEPTLPKNLGTHSIYFYAE